MSVHLFGVRKTLPSHAALSHTPLSQVFITNKLKKRLRSSSCSALVLIVEAFKMCFNICMLIQIISFIYMINLISSVT